MSIGSQEWSGLTLASGRYQIIAKLGEGGMGFVYRALDQNIDAEVVIKVPRQAMMDDPEFAGRFTREIRSLVKLSHPTSSRSQTSATTMVSPSPSCNTCRAEAWRISGRRAGRPTSPMRSQISSPLAPGGRRGPRLYPCPGLCPPRRQTGQYPLRHPGLRVPERFRRRKVSLGHERRLLANRNDGRRDGARYARIHGAGADHG